MFDSIATSSTTTTTTTTSTSQSLNYPFTSSIQNNSQSKPKDSQSLAPSFDLSSNSNSDSTSNSSTNSSLFSEIPLLNHYSTNFIMAPPQPQTSLSPIGQQQIQPSSTQEYSYQQPIPLNQSPHLVQQSHLSSSPSSSGATQGSGSTQIQPNPTIISPSMISGTGASSNPPMINSKINSKFSNHDIQILKQLLIAGEKHKWKQITKEINQSTNHNNHVLAAIQLAAEKGQTYYGNLTGGGYSNKRVVNGNSPKNIHHLTSSNIPTKNVSPTFVVKQYQQLLGLPNNTLFFGSLQSSLPYVVAENGWNDIPQDAYNYGFNNDGE
ncbi:unnamed protein product [Candida verbasci]|uniref:Uncharacterized protein n=1 Tax=Candida verbasci TaxID=1227364 RepID=A0A9W4TXW5_9ASCO|nr:unnamed protein product [Candida verbasci]